VKPAPFTYHRATSTREAVDMLTAVADDASVLAGGQSLVPLMNFRVAQPAHLVDINFVDELDYIRVDDGWLAIGARVRQAALERSEDVARAAPLLAEAIRFMAHPPVRHRGTVVGSVAHADPAAELPAVLLALDGEVVLQGADGERRVAAAEFFIGPLMTARAPGELVTEIRVPAANDDGNGARGHALVEFSRRHADFAVAGAVVAPGAVALFGVSATPVRAAKAERLLAGDPGAAPADVAAAATDGLEPGDDVHGGADYRRRVARTCVERALERARGGAS
jgi:aerobic carbon-monoxide dehydrogenase medium subunit